jgi:hypothetical protein
MRAPLVMHRHPATRSLSPEIALFQGRNPGEGPMARMVGIAAAAIALAGCEGGGEQPQAAPKTKVEIANPYQEQMRNLTPINRALALKRAIQDTGQRCTRMLGSAYVGEYERLHMWTGRCQAPDRDFAVFIAANGDVQVRNCAETAQLNLPACKEPELLPKS